MDKKKKRLIIALLLLAVLAAFVLSPVFPYARSLAVMSVYSPYCAKDSLLASKNIALHIPSGEGWYPFVMTFSADDAFSEYTKAPGTKLTILYNFPAFSVKDGCSRLFDESSPYYSSFYGAYIVSREDAESFGFSPDTGKLDESAVSNIASFDFFNLVLGDFGLSVKGRVFDASVTEQEIDVPFAGYDGWTRVCSDITVNGVSHTKKGFVGSYLQYGSPSFPVSSDFAPVKMKSVVLAKYFSEWNCSVFFYVMSPSEEVCAACEKEILSRSSLKSAD